MMVGANVQAARPNANARMMMASQGKLFPFLGLSTLMVKFIRDDIGTSHAVRLIPQSGFFVEALRRKTGVKRLSWAARARRKRRMAALTG
jgi:hypothetical protein